MNGYWIGIIVLVLVVVVFRFTLSGSGASRAAAHEKIKQGALVVDVRTPSEFSTTHYEGATNIPVQELNGRLAQLGDKKRAIVVYCASGMRSAQAARILTAAGFTDVTDAGGLGNLK